MTYIVIFEYESNGSAVAEIDEVILEAETPEDAKNKIFNMYGKEVTIISVKEFVFVW